MNLPLHDKKKSKKNLKGFSLIEISIVLLIIGIIVGATLKGRDLISLAQVKSVASDIESLQLAYANYVSSYGAIPGNDSSAKERFGGGVENGSGNGIISADDAKKVFQGLCAADLISSPTFKTPKIGGNYEIIVKDNSMKIKISNNGAAFITKKQLISLKAKLIETLGDKKGAIETDPAEISDDDSKKYIAIAALD